MKSINPYPVRCLQRFGRAALLTGVLSLAVTLSSYAGDLYGPAASSPTTGGTLNMGLLVEPPGLDPFHQAADARIRLTVLIYQGLFYESADGQAMPLLAESVDITDEGKTYTVKLRQGVKFHNGQAMTAIDVAYSYNYIRNPKNGSPGAGDFANIEAIEVVDPQTIRISLNTPNASLPMTLGNKYGAVVPAGFFDQEGARNRLNAVSVGTGPFKLVEFNPNANLVLERNPDYWQKDMPYLDRINFSFLPNSASMLIALRNKRVDLVPLERPQDARQTTGIDGIKIDRFASLNQKSLDLGAELKPLDNVKVRQAISLAVDKQQIKEAAIGDQGTVIGTMVAGMQERWGVPMADLPMQGPDIAKAKALLKEAGLDAGFGLTLTTINGYDWMDPAAVTLKQQLAPIGIDLTIQRVDLGVWIKNFRAQQMGLTFNDWATQPDPNLLFYRHFHQRPQGADFRNWYNAAASELLDQGRAEADFDKRRAIYARFQQILAETVPTIMLFSADHVIARRDSVRNFVQHPTGWYYGLARTWLKR